MTAFLAPSLLNGRAYLAPADTLSASLPNNTGGGSFDLSKIPTSRKVVFSGGTRVVQFAGYKRTVRF